MPASEDPSDGASAAGSGRRIEIGLTEPCDEWLLKVSGIAVSEYRHGRLAAQQDSPGLFPGVLRNGEMVCDGLGVSGVSLQR